MLEKQDYEARLETKLEEWRSRIVSLREKAERMDPEQRASCQKTIDRLETQRSEMETILANLNMGDERSFEEDRRGGDIDWSIMEDGLSTALARFN